MGEFVRRVSPGAAMHFTGGLTVMFATESQAREITARYPHVSCIFTQPDIRFQESAVGRK